MNELTPTEPQPAAVPRATPARGFSAVGATHRGFTRPSNQDAFRIEPELGIVVVADGVAGAAGGGIASRITVNAVCEILVEAGTPVPAAGETPAQAAARIFRAALAAAHWRVRE
jgi:PPM family protein phosphatase